MAPGTAHPMSAYRGQVVVVNFWATWCVPCVKEIPAFSKVHSAHGSRVAFVGLGIDSPDAIRAFDARFKPSYPLLAAGASGSDLARAFGNDAGALPFTVVLDATGRVVALAPRRGGRSDARAMARAVRPRSRPRRPTVGARREFTAVDCTNAADRRQIRGGSRPGVVLPSPPVRSTVSGLRAGSPRASCPRRSSSCTAPT